MILSLVAAITYLLTWRASRSDSVLPVGIHIFDYSNEDVGVGAAKAMIVGVSDDLIPRDSAHAHANLAHGSKLAKGAIERHFVRCESWALTQDFAGTIAGRPVDSRQNFEVGKVIALLNLKE
ncbi:hypothetical protein NHF48_019675 [Sphingomonas sp. H160509]|uniref:hypothetical protein n=1 Tax=Sphingomonas sp. H160509 TaxID=2955313 RepID=UPI0021E7FF44|nr:hypothetical protein [Sphingomonas sp. H160509]MDD1452638.1 hypothetical protein [Sphingomonas sp. H160509]